jgi:uncharacterized membrane protein
MNYSSGVVGLTSLSVAQLLPSEGLFWLVARILLDVAGGLFLLYLFSLWVLSAYVLMVAPRRVRQ